MRKSQRITKVIAIYPEGEMKVCKKFHSDPVNIHNHVNLIVELEKKRQGLPKSVPLWGP